MSRYLSNGSVGEDVRNLQRLLNYHLSLPYKPLVVDGIFGPLTHARVVEFQKLNSLLVDGIVGPQTRKALLEVRDVQMYGTFQPAETKSFSPSNLRLAFSFPTAAAGRAAPGVLLADNDPPTTQAQNQTQNQPSSKVETSVQIQAGSQVNAFPWFISPLVLTGQLSFLAKNSGRPDFMITFGGQLAWNVNSPSGAWSAQGFVQMGPNLGLKFFNDRLDVLNPFVQIMLQQNQGQPLSFGLALGNQLNVALDNNNRWSLFLNGQIVTNVGLNDGLCSAPAGQLLGGVGLNFDIKK
jgi:hypothetical protein